AHGGARRVRGLALGGMAAGGLGRRDVADGRRGGAADPAIPGFAEAGRTGVGGDAGAGGGAGRAARAGARPGRLAGPGGGLADALGPGLPAATDRADGALGPARRAAARLVAG